MICIKSRLVAVVDFMIDWLPGRVLGSLFWHLIWNPFWRTDETRHEFRI